MFRGQELGSQSIQVPIESIDGPWTAGLWTDTPLRNVDHQSNPEIDYYASYSRPLCSDLDVKAGLTLYTYPENNLNDGFRKKMGVGEGYYRSTFEPNVGLDYTIAGLKLTPTYSYDTVLRGSNYDLAAVYAVPMKDAGAEIDFNANTGYYLYSDASKIYSNVGAVKSRGDYWSLGASVPFHVARNLKLAIGWAYEDGDGHLTQNATQISNRECVRRGVFSASMSYRF